jgi:hypothetical protein
MTSAWEETEAAAWTGRKPPKLRRRRAQLGMSESQIQIAVMNHLRMRGRAGVVVNHVPNGGGRSPAEAGRFKAEGVLAGWPDLQLGHAGVMRFLELKTEVGTLSRTQRHVHDLLRAAGFEVAVAHGLDAALAQLEAWGLLKTDRTTKGAP